MADGETPTKPSSSRSSSRSKGDRESSRRSGHNHRSSKSKSRSSSSKNDDETKHRPSSHRKRGSEKDQETTDVEAKRTATAMQGSVRPGGVAVGVIWAKAGNASDEKAVSERRKTDSHRKSSRRESQDEKDKESKNRSSRSTKHPMQPGAVAGSRGSQTTRSKRNDSPSRTSNNRRSHGDRRDREMQKAARASTTIRRSIAGRRSDTTTRRSSSTHPENQGSDTATGASNNEDAYEIQAELVEDNEDENKRINQRMNERLRDQMQGENDRLRREMADENERLRKQMEEMKQKAKEEKKRKKKRNCIIVLVVLVLIGGGVGAFFGFRGSKAADPVDANNTPTVEETTSPTDLVGTTPSPSDDPSVSPTRFLKYPPPSQEDCDAVVQQQPVEGEESMKVMGYAIDMEAILSSNAEPETIRSDVEAKLRSVLIPSLVGCADAERRQLRGRDGQGHRQLANELQFAIANGKVTVRLSEDACESDTTQTCYRMEVILELWIKGDEKIVNIMSIVLNLLQQDDLVEFLTLNEPTHILVAAKFRSTDKTDPPSASPTDIPSIPPSMPPSSSPSTSPPTDEPSENPTRMPVVGATPDPTTPSPTVTPLTPAPTCPGVDAYFDGSFNQQNGSQDARYNVECTASTDLVALTYNSDTCAVECAAFLPSASFSQICSENNRVRFTLPGNYQNENVLIGFRSASNTLTCGSNMILITDTPTAAPFPGSTPVPTITASSVPTLFPTSAPTSVPTSKPTNAPTSTPTSAPTDTPTLSPTSVPTSQPTEVPTDPPTNGPTRTPTGAPTSGPTSAPTPTSRRNYYEALLDGIAVNTDAMNWLIDSESWDSTRTDSRLVEEILERLDLIRLYQAAGGIAWTAQADWMSSQHHCGWFGITCSGDFVTNIDLSGNNLIGSIPTEIGRLGNLLHLQMNQNDFESASQGLPTELSLLTKLTHLNVCVAKLQGTIPALVDMVDLTHLNLRRNDLVGSVPVLPRQFSGSDCSNCLLQKNGFGDFSNANENNCKVEFCNTLIGCSTICLSESSGGGGDVPDLPDFPDFPGFGGGGGWP